MLLFPQYGLHLYKIQNVSKRVPLSDVHIIDTHDKETLWHIGAEMSEDFGAIITEVSFRISDSRPRLKHG